MSKDLNPQHAHGLDALRAAAALSVLGLHVVLIGGWTAYPETGPLAWLRVGNLGVDVFFVLSGYVITGSALALMETAKDHWRRAFLWRRAARIYPLYLLTSLLFLLCVNSAALTGADAWWQVLSHLLLVHNWLITTSGSINGVAWSIGTEAQLYLMTAWLLPWLGHLPPWRIVLGAFVLAWTWRALSLWWVPLLIDGATENTIAHTAAQWPGFADAYGLGTALALLPAGFAYARRWRLLCGIGGILLMALSAEFYLGYTRTGDYWSTPWVATFALTVPALAAALLVLALRHWVTSPRAPWVLLGVWSYGLYLWHLPVLQWLQQHTSLKNAALAAATLAASVALAALSWYLLEQPAIRYGRSRGLRAVQDRPRHADAG